MATGSGNDGAPRARGRRGRELWRVIAASVVGTLLAFATYAVGFVARPVGGVIAGHLGDRAGRRGVLVATLLAAGVLALLAAVLSDDAFTSWGWRVPFLLSAILVFIGLYIRLRIEESPMFQEVEETATRAKTPIVDVVKVHPRQLAIALGALVLVVERPEAFQGRVRTS